MSVVIDQQDNKVIEIDGEPKTLIIQGVGLPGLGVPAGGAKGEVLAKASNADFDTEWADLKPTMIVTSIIFG